MFSTGTRDGFARPQTSRSGPKVGQWPLPNWCPVRNPTLVEQALLLGLDLDEPKAIAVLRGMALNPDNPAELRSRSLEALVERHVPRLATDLQALVEDPALRGLALRLLAAYDDPATPEVVLRHFKDFSAAEREDAIATLAARPGMGEGVARRARARPDPPARRERLDRPSVAGVW